MLRTRATKLPGEPGTRGLLRKYGERLLRVRTRYDEESGLVFKTVELIEESSPAGNDARRRTRGRPPRRSIPPPHQIVTIEIDPWERPLAHLLHSAGAWPGPRRGTCRIPFGVVTTLRLEDRVAPPQQTPAATSDSRRSSEPATPTPNPAR